MKKAYKTGLVLNNGYARAFFQVGVLASLEGKVAFDVIVGTGMGAYIGAVLASGKPISLIETVARSLKPEDFVCPSCDDRCFFTIKPLMTKLENIIGNPIIEDLPKKFIVVASDFGPNTLVLIKNGSVLSAVEASMTEPGFHLPYQLNNQGLADGSMINPFPTDIAWDNGADTIVAIDTVSQHLRPFDENKDDLSFWVKNAKPGFPQLWLMHKNKIPWMEMRMMETSFTYAIDNFLDARQPEILIQLEEAEGSLPREAFIDSFDKINGLIDLGKTHGQKILPRVLEKLQQLGI
ncbi:hypothetical protein A2872_03980 [Candidatus Gottesmanbacteria bacterium RIFCSPHIGHO2_01_FULL_42_12]|uniref:PNPLA domain-containing protein n=1 Tax=Candidatus Gottesmanbacteria bacterium RIFCSPHIGHO2_01_FULL_42_12 TaxID=1798377 RepID=A0A1F5Z3Z4_9BACT|nr:MAG: hypothetical protein A2872_03980 [Candidatus Gottesmanbacteria bacterium RIFCSPHIGHO2_01_FULL_42_12]